MPANTFDIRHSIRIAGAFIAWVIGSGFATGQEMLRFYASFGLCGYGAVAVNLVGFLGMAYLLMRTGFEHKKESAFNHFQFFCGQNLGLVYTWLIIATLILLMPVLVAGAGATLYEYYRVPQPLGSAVMTALLLAAYLMGFERLIQVISSIGPVIIVFSLAIGCGAIAVDYGQFSRIGEYESALAPYQAAPNWFLSAVLHLSLNFFPPSMYFIRLGISASSKQELRAGAFLGAFVVILCIAVMTTAILLNGSAAAGLDVPVLYLAQKLHPLLGTAFSITLLLGIFSSSSVMMWSICSRVTRWGKKGNVAFAVAVALFTYVVSLFSFGRLVAVLYPAIGYAGLLFIARVVYKSFRK